MDVGIRELKAKLSEYVGRAAGGETLVVTDRGQPVAQLGPHPGQSVLQRGIEEGWIEPPKSVKLAPVHRFVAKHSILEVLDEDRG
ncbi:type II toxin-antitoxin system Phd/YefM family antitoxin [Candidatus Poriferisocius sp.]|uniref:type II toxin-antitoxin system Phd/YefM family antitoxin n=1 Tax=Candidatus Poriferisocius sp. TaxID=3101276 RepID=UPI003B5AF893